MRSHRLSVLVMRLALLLTVTGAWAEDADPVAFTADEILDTLKRSLEWAQQTRATMHAGREAGVSIAVREEEQVVVRVLQRAFEAARAQATLVVQAPSGSQAPGGSDDSRARTVRRAERRARLEASIRETEREVERTQARARTAPRAQREAREREARAASNRLSVDRMRLELLNSLEQADVSLSSSEPDLLQQIQALQETVPEVGAASTPPKGATAPAATAPAANATPTTTPSFGTWASLRRLFALSRARGTLAQLALSTEKLAREADVDVQQTREAVRDLGRTLRAATGVAPSSGSSGHATSGTAPSGTRRGAAARESSSSAGAASPDTTAKSDAASAATMGSLSEQEFRTQLERLKLLGATLVPLRAEVALLRRFEGDLRQWQRGIDRDFRSELQNLALGLVGVVLALGVILIGGILWRVAVHRYVTDPYRRRLALNVRRVVLAAAFVLVLVFHFTTELTALVTALGFAAAGIAFALQNVILSVAGYFSMVAPNGIRVGDRVSLQGPFGYVHGDVIEIGLVRIRLRELTAETLEPTGRIVVFPNSVVFTGSFFKHPPAQAKAA
jgi:hypothetical protein